MGTRFQEWEFNNRYKEFLMREWILTEKVGDLATVVLNRPDKFNALTKEMWGMLGNTIGALSRDESLRGIIIRGAGDKSFSPGNDIAEFKTDRFDSESAKAYGALMHGTLRTLSQCPVPTVAMIHGICVGGGMEIAGACDIRICGESSRFGAPINTLGLVMAYPELSHLRELVGKKRALEILLEGKLFGAAEAKEMGIVTRVVADVNVESESKATARNIADGAPLVARWHKNFLNRLDDSTELTEEELDEGFACYDTEDFAIGYNAFLAKTRPRFKGR
tara:strand:+ start:47 stop:880 length:834 start_codon:yes stop_codon:yes gene_type:complete